MLLAVAVYLLPSNGFASAENLSCSTSSRPFAFDSFKGLWMASCVSTCSKVFQIETANARRYFEANCARIKTREARVPSFFEASANIVDLLDLALVRCLPEGGKKAVYGTYEFVKSLPALVGYLLSSDGGGAAGQVSEPSAAEKWRACSQSQDCKRALARNTLRFREMNTDRSWKISDEEVDRALAKISFNELVLLAESDQLRSREECARDLSRIRREVVPGGDEWTLEKHKEVFDRLSEGHPHCPGALKLKPPSLAAEASSDNNRDKCPKGNSDPSACLSVAGQFAVGDTCLGEDFSEESRRLRREFCSEVVQYLVPIPLIGPQTRFLSKVAKGEKILPVPRVGGLTLAETFTPDKIETLSSRIARTDVMVPKTREVRTFVDKYRSIVPVDESQNRRYIALASDAREGKRRFFDVENSVMKQLNDLTNNKDLVTSLTNYQKEVFLKQLDGLKAKYPSLKFELYSDFKSVKIAMESTERISPELSEQILRDLRTAYKKSHQEFASEVKRLGISIADLPEPEKWFRAGFGQSLDEAALAARRARQVDGETRVLNFTDEEVRDHMTARLQQIEADRKSMAQADVTRSLLETSQSGVVLPKQDVFDLVRKHGSPAGLARAISDRYGIDFKIQDAALLQRYVKGVDEFSPSILIAKREVMSLDGARGGGLSADFLGLGSANLKATAEGIAARATVDEALRGARSGEQAVTKMFHSRMENFKKTVGGDVTCSGDDCVRLAQKAMSDKEKTRILDALARSPDTRQVRLSFVGAEVPRELRMQLASHGEAIEKVFRKELEGHVSFERLQKMTFGFDMQTATLNEGKVNLIIGKTSEVRLSVKERDEIQKAFARALEDYNQSGRTYVQGSSRTLEMRVRLYPGSGPLIMDDPSERTDH